MRNAGLEEAQAGIKIAGRNINNLRYADDTTLMAESEEEVKSLLMKVKVAQFCPTLCDPMDYSVHGILQARILESVAVPFCRGSSQPRPPALQADALPAEPPGKPKNTGMCNLSLLQQIFPIQESNWGLLHCRCIFYLLSHREIEGH